jgi:hypothetical protein
VSSLFDWLQHDTLSQFLENFPTVAKEQALRAMELAAKFVSDKHFLDEIAA